MSRIEIENFTVRRGNFQLGPLTLDIASGEIFALLGRTGAGKTVLLEAIAGMYRGDEGRILLNGVEVTTLSPADRGLGLVYQDRGLFPHMRVEENIGYGLRMARVPKEIRRRRVEELMELLSITQIRRQYPGTISGGEAQRTALARALALKPQVLLLDEPFSALDPATKKGLYQELQLIHQRFRCTIVLVTHDFNEAQLLADRVGVLLDGRLLAVAPGPRLLEGHYCKEVEIFLGRTL